MANPITLMSAMSQTFEKIIANNHKKAQSDFEWLPDNVGSLYTFQVDTLAYLHGDLFNKGILESMTTTTLLRGEHVLSLGKSLLATHQNKIGLQFAIWIFLHKGQTWFVYGNDVKPGFVAKENV